MYSYEIHKIINNPLSTNGFNAALSANGSRIILGDTMLPAFFTGSIDTQPGSFKVYDIIYDSRKHIFQMNQVGDVVTGDTDENLAAGVVITDDGSMVAVSSNTEIFKIYKFNIVTKIWDVYYTPGPDHGLGSGLNISGLRATSDFRHIITANVDNNTGMTSLLYYRRTTATSNAWEMPAYAMTTPFLERFNAIRGLVMSDAILVENYNGPIIIHVQQVPMQNNAVIISTRLAENNFFDYGYFPEYSPSDMTIQALAVGITQNADHAVVTYIKNSKINVDMYVWDFDTYWYFVHKFEIIPDDINTIQFSYPYLNNESSGDLPSKLCLSMNYGLSNDSIFGVYDINYTVQDSYSLTQSVSFAEKLTALASNNPLPLGLLGSMPSRDFSVIATPFMGPDPDSDPNTNPNYSTVYYFTTPAPNVTNVGVIDSHGIGIALFVYAQNAPRPLSPPRIPDTPTLNETTTPAGVSTGVRILVGAGVLAVIGLIFFLFFYSN